MTNEFPESGLAVRAFVSSLAGVNADTDALTIRPDIPTGLRSLRADAVRYQGVPISVTVGADGLRITAEAPMSGTLRYAPPAAGAWNAVRTGADGAAVTGPAETGADGMLTIDLTGLTALTVRR